MISVSKLCCPVCWELFQVLNLDTKIRGCHPTVTPTTLPDTLSPDVSKEMVKRFQVHLVTQLRSLLSESKTSIRTRTTQHHRNESESGYSAASSNVGELDHYEAYVSWQP